RGRPPSGARRDPQPGGQERQRRAAAQPGRAARATSRRRETAMSLRSFFASLFRTGPRNRRRTSRTRLAGPFAFEQEWAALLAGLGLPPSAFRDVVETDSLHPHFHYRHFTKPKRDGGRREIAAPDVKLKAVQHAIIARYFGKQETHPAAVAYRAGKST